MAPAVVLLDDCDPKFKGDGPHRDGVRAYTAEGKELWAIRTLNNCQAYGANHGVAIDAKRERIYIRELVAKRVTALDLKGNVIYRVADVDVSALAVHPASGHLWCVGSAKSFVLDRTGETIAKIPTPAFDIAHDVATDSFWFASHKELHRIDAAGKNDLLKEPTQAGYAFVSIACAPFAGGAWVVERSHRDVAPSVDQLVFVSIEGKLVKQFGRDGWHPFAVACDPKAGTAWVADLREGLYRVPLEGDDVGHWKIAAVSVAVGAEGRDVWVATPDDVLRLDANGTERGRFKIGKESAQSWLAAF